MYCTCAVNNGFKIGFSTPIVIRIIEAFAAKIVTFAIVPAFEADKPAPNDTAAARVAGRVSGETFSKLKMRVSQPNHRDLQMNTAVVMRPCYRTIE